MFLMNKIKISRAEECIYEQCVEKEKKNPPLKNIIIKQWYVNNTSL